MATGAKDTLKEYVLKYRPLPQIPLLDTNKIFLQNFTYEDCLEVIRATILSVENDIKNSENKKINVLFHL